MQHLRLFPTNVGIFDVENSHELISEILKIPDITSSEYKFINRNNVWDLKSDYPVLQKLHDVMLNSAAEYASQSYDYVYKPEYFTHSEGWVETVKPHSPADQMMHNHRLTHIAAVFYLNTADKCGDLDLVDPRGTLGFASLDSQRPYNVFRFTPENGKLILFPGWMLHFVHPNRSDVTRQIIASNIQLRNDITFNEPTHQLQPGVSSLKLS